MESIPTERAVMPWLLAGLFVFLASCSPRNEVPALPGISPSEREVLISTYYWENSTQPLAYTDRDLAELLGKSADKTLDGATAEEQTSAVVSALVTVGDDRFSKILGLQPIDVQRAVYRAVHNLWDDHHLDYPKTREQLENIR